MNENGNDQQAGRITKRVGVSFYDETHRIVEGVNEDMSLRNFSMAVRYIVHDWKKRVEVERLTELMSSGSPFPS